MNSDCVYYPRAEMNEMIYDGTEKWSSHNYCELNAT